MRYNCHPRNIIVFCCFATGKRCNTGPPLNLAHHESLLLLARGRVPEQAAQGVRGAALGRGTRSSELGAALPNTALPEHGVTAQNSRAQHSAAYNIAPKHVWF